MSRKHPTSFAEIAFQLLGGKYPTEPHTHTNHLTNTLIVANNTPMKPTDAGPKPIISITIDGRLLIAIDAIANKQRRSRSQTIQLLLEQAIEEVKKGKSQANEQGG